MSDERPSPDKPTPVDGTPLLPQLRDELVSAAARRALRPGRVRRRDRSRPATTRPSRWSQPKSIGLPGSPRPAGPLRSASGLRFAALAVLVALVASLVSSSSEPASADVEVTVAGGWVTVRVVDLETDPSAVERAAAAAGLDVVVVAVPTGPSLVGRFVSASGTELPEELERVDVDGDGFDGFRLPQGWSGSLRLGLGVPTTDAYETATDAYAPGEPLACSGLWGLPLVAALPELSDLVDALSLTVLDGPAPVTFTRPSEALGRYGDWFVTDAAATAPDAVTVFIHNVPASPFPVPRSPSQGRCP